MIVCLNPTFIGKSAVAITIFILLLLLWHTDKCTPYNNKAACFGVYVKNLVRVYTIKHFFQEKKVKTKIFLFPCFSLLGLLTTNIATLWIKNLPWYESLYEPITQFGHQNWNHTKSYTIWKHSTQLTRNSTQLNVAKVSAIEK